MKSLSLIITIIITIVFSLSPTNANAQNWNQIVKVCASDRGAGDFYGYSVSVSDQWAVVGAYMERENVSGGATLTGAGSAYILRKDGNTWVQHQKIVASDRAANDFFGYSVAIHGNYIIVGAYQEDENELGSGTMGNTGSVYIFHNNSGTWSQVQKICAADRSTDDFFGCSLAINGDWIIVGAYQEDENEIGGAPISSAGSAYIFKNNAGIWSQQQKIVASDRSAADFFGYSVAICDNYAIVGAYSEDEDALGLNTALGAGSAYIFKNNAGSWNQIKKIVHSDREASDYFGFSVDITDEYAVIGAYGEQSESGAVYVFKNNLDSWAQSAKLIASDRANSDRFGYSVATHNDQIVVGASLEDHDALGENPLTNPGSAYVFKNISDVWTQVQKIVASDRGGSDNYGVSVSIFDNQIICGAHNEDHDANGGVFLSNSGSVYFYRNSPEINLKQNVTDIASGGIYNFGSVLFGNSSSAISFTIENTGGGDLNLTGTPKIDKSTGDVAAFTINQASVSSPVAPAGSTSFTVTYTPPAGGAHTTNLVIANDDSDENPYTIVLQGTGTLQNQTISNFNAIPTKTYGDVAFTVSATASSGLNVVFTSSNPSVATCTGTNGTTITIVGAGDCEIRANQAGNAFYNAAPQVVQTLTVNTKTISVTADPQSKIYGDDDPTLTYTFTPTLVGSDSFSGALTRIVGECGNCYAQIQQGTLTLGDNYTINYTPDDLFIAKRPLTVTVSPNQSKVYGTANPTPYTYTYTGTLVFAQTFVGALTRNAGETVGLYPITQGTLTVNANYDITFEGDDFEITAKPITVTANSGQTKVYGQSNPGAYSYTVTGTLVGGDNFSGALAREPGEDVGPYQIQQGTLSLSSNYALNYSPADFIITEKAITVVAISNQNKYYGDSDPVLNYYLMGLLESGDSFSGQLSREAGEVIGFYPIQIGTLTAGPNYSITLNSTNFEIKIRPITITVDAGQSKIYGEADPAEFTFSTNVGIASWDSFTGALTRTAGENVGSYPITQGTLALNSNYIISFSGSNFGINTKLLTVTADAGQTKVYGESDPASFTYVFTGTLETGDTFTGELVRDFGENVGIYEIEQGSLTAGSNYLIEYTHDYFEITARPINLIVDANQTKIYGDLDPMFTFSFSDALVSGDTYSGALSREIGQNVGFYEILQGSVVLPNNYDVTFFPADFEIITKNIVVTADPNQAKLYGDSDPEFTYSTNSAIASWDNYSGVLIRAAGETPGLYEISQGTLALNSNYNMSFVGDDFEILVRQINVNANTGQGKDYGESDPDEYTYTYDGILLGGDNFSGALTREAGENVGLYEIMLGDLMLTPNYEIVYVPADFEIFRANPVITWEDPADIYNNEALSATQLNATANVDGSFEYNPNFGTLMEVGENQPLAVTFIPIDLENYHTADKTVYINVLLWVGLENYINSTLNVYPNPTTGIINLDLTEIDVKNIRITDISGRLILEKSVVLPNETLDLSMNPAGVYFITIQISDKVFTSKIVLQ
jgi:hypothetical protein